MLGAKWPAGVIKVNSVILEISSFELVPMDNVHDQFIDEDEKRENSSYDPYDERFEDIGTETRIFATNMGFAIIVILSYLVLTLLWLILFTLERAGLC